MGSGIHVGNRHTYMYMYSIVWDILVHIGDRHTVHTCMYVQYCMAYIDVFLHDVN